MTINSRTDLFIQISWSDEPQITMRLSPLKMFVIIERDLCDCDDGLKRQTNTVRYGLAIGKQYKTKTKTKDEGLGWFNIQFGNIFEKIVQGPYLGGTLNSIKTRKLPLWPKHTDVDVLKCRHSHLLYWNSVVLQTLEIYILALKPNSIPHSKIILSPFPWCDSSVPFRNDDFSYFC